jgi:tetratricopeptide (TPR) repeat protein
MRDYNEEKAVLHQIYERIKKFEALVSYNGKAYDVNILTSRLTLGRMDPSFLNLPHLDLLFSVRRVWSQRIGACNLSHVEREILGFNRQDDIPSFMIPGLYFEYLKTGNGGCVEPIFTHNKWDIVALVVLAAILGRIYQSPADSLDHPFDLISIGKSFDRLFRHREAVVCFRKALQYPLETHEREQVLRWLGFSLKRAGDWENAAEVWEEMAGKHPDQIVPYEELAKYYEHQLRDYDRAIDIVNRALASIDLFSQLHPDIPYGNDRRDLEYRLARLKRKKENHSGKD